MRIAVCQFEDRDNQDDLNKLMLQNMEYCRIHGYDHVRLKSLEEQVPPYWAKVFVIRNALRDYDVVLMLDSDAVVHGLDKKIGEVLFGFPGEHVFYADDVWFSEANAGVLIFTKEAKDIVDFWLSLYHPDMWHYNKTSKKWKCDGIWAGPEYEQGSLIKYIVKNPKYTNRLQALPSRFLQGPWTSSEDESDVFTIHFAGGFRHEIDAYLKHHDIKRLHTSNTISRETNVFLICIAVFAIVLCCFVR